MGFFRNGVKCINNLSYCFHSRQFCTSTIQVLKFDSKLVMAQKSILSFFQKRTINTHAADSADKTSNVDSEKLPEIIEQRKRTVDLNSGSEEENKEVLPDELKKKESLKITNKKKETGGLESGSEEEYKEVLPDESKSKKSLQITNKRKRTVGLESGSEEENEGVLPDESKSKKSLQITNKRKRTVGLESGSEEENKEVTSNESNSKKSLKITNKRKRTADVESNSEEETKEVSPDETKSKSPEITNKKIETVAAQNGNRKNNKDVSCNKSKIIRAKKTRKKLKAKETISLENKETLQNGVDKDKIKSKKTLKKLKAKEKDKERVDLQNSGDENLDESKHISEKNTAEESKNENKLLIHNTSTEVIASNYNPSKAKYHPIDDAFWKHGERVPYLALAKTLQKIEEVTKRLTIIDILANYFRSVIVLSENDLLPSIYLCLNKLGPAYEGQELGIADTYLMKAIAQCTGRTLAQIKSDVAKIGDLGIVAERSRTNQRIMYRPAPLKIQSVFNQLTEIANFSGKDSITKKIDKIQAIFVACRDCEARFIIRSLAGKLRIGLAEQSVLQALALACVTTPTNQEYPPTILNAGKKVSPVEFKKKVDEELLTLKTTYCECPNYNMIVPVLLKHGIKSLPEHCKITSGIPVMPMLAHPTKGANEVFERFDGMKFTCEWKYDGERAQIHVLEDKTIKVYSRNQEDNTSKYPDVISGFREMIKPEIKSCILDAEIVAWDREQNKIMSFQILSTRKRKDALIADIKVPVCVFMFDLLYLNGESLTQKPLTERRTLLKEHFQEVEGKISFVTYLDTNTMEEVQEFLDESVKGCCEGLMVKTLDTEASYEIAKRSRNWLKLKKDYLDVGDTLDLVVIGGYNGKGKRTGQYGGFLMASYDTENEEYQTICRLGSGFSDEDLTKFSEFFKEHIITGARPYYRYDTWYNPDIWFEAVQVWEIKCADLTLSPTSSAGIGLVDPGKGISLRFPRFLRVREDKRVEQATSSEQIAELYRSQDQIKNQAPKKNAFNEEDI